MIRSFKAVQLNEHAPIQLQFHSDINIITGKNGSGKTTLLKLLWYVISGNLERIVPEISFESFELVTDSMTIGMSIEKSGKRPMVKLRCRGSDVSMDFERPLARVEDWKELQIANKAIINSPGESIFFPTFRRIEGGFSIPNLEDDGTRHAGAIRYRDEVFHRLNRDRGGLQAAMDQLSQRLTVDQHRFVASISTYDIVRLLTAQYAEVSEKTNRMHMELSEFILRAIQQKSHDEPHKVLSEIQSRARNVTELSESHLRPFTVLSSLISRVFQYKGIKLSDPVTLGEAREAIGSELLSAGEKQMLSFLCYNAFASSASIFIDEPEISLHVDWQRIIFPLLLEQSTGNQFIIATHSPFIYSKYSDKELVLSSDRGE